MTAITQETHLLPEINSSSECIRCSMGCAKITVIFVTEGDFADLLNCSFSWEQIRTDLLDFSDVTPWSDYTTPNSGRKTIWRTLRLQVWFGNWKSGVTTALCSNCHFVKSFRAVALKIHYFRSYYATTVVRKRTLEERYGPWIMQVSKRWDFKDNTYHKTHNKDNEFAALKSWTCSALCLI